MGEGGAQKLVKFIAVVHDIGKATPVFQRKKSYDHNDNLDWELLHKLEREGLKGLSEALFTQVKVSPHTVAGEAILEEAGLNPTIGALIGGHHGKPLSQNSQPKKQLIVYSENYYQDSGNKEIKQKWKNIHSELINMGLREAEYDDIHDVPKELSQPSAVIIEGLLVMADWLASSESMSDGRKLFPLIDINQKFKDSDLEERFEKAILNWYSEEGWSPEVVSNTKNTYQHYWGFSPRFVQEKITDKVKEIANPGIAVIEAPMGIGKTELALVLAQEMAAKTGADGLYIGLPTQATTNAMFGRVNEWLTKVAQDQEENLSIKLMHGKAKFNKIYRNLPDAWEIDADGGDENFGTVSVSTWFSGKKSILTKFTVGTIDNLLLLGLKQKHLYLRHLAFSGKVVILDEVHAYDAYMSSYLEKALQWLGAYHVPVILLSATLPKQKRKDLVEAYLIGKYQKKKILEKAITFPNDWAETKAYPLLTVTDENKLLQVTRFSMSNEEGKEVAVKCINFEDLDLVELVLEKISNGGVAGIIVNTVKRAQSLAKFFEEIDVDFLVLHSAFVSPERARIEEKLQHLIGKNGERPYKMVIIGTQVLEQSLDVDFDILFTDIAPMDLLLQRIGRLHRHNILRPSKLKCPEIYILGIEDNGFYGEANEDIYTKYLLMRTEYYLPKKLQLPNDISFLVQEVYDFDDELVIEGFENAKEEFMNLKNRAKEKSKVFQIGKPIRGKRASLAGWLDREHSDPKMDDLKAAAAVRDIQETIEVILVKQTTSGYCLLSGQLIENVTSEELANQTVRLPYAVIKNLTETIAKLEDITRKKFYTWQSDPWLKGQLALVLDNHQHVKLNGYDLIYDSGCGLSYEGGEQ
ncbi:hypothetical protein FC36_GL001901 [Ligilactobacillus equi DSM 15833 = JCM 10991]|uniref:HD Cas3-type domain-containing protein n=1 Tax=Ligilactobacillus equi DSM 15833 = JCM 10991 TaxID=1423740 RepID=A0A0R1TD11_9LACO|nr:hypothetical protein FC36_GL001901 [Ligilactobacillus equi DSM 15833 = JCM 10991]